MSSDGSCSGNSPDSQRQHWLPLIGLLVLVAIEGAVFAWCYGGLLLSIRGKLAPAVSLAFAVLMVVGGGLRGHFSSHVAESRSVRFSAALFASQIALFLIGMAFLQGVSSGASRAWLGDTGGLLAGFAIAVAWLGVSLATAVPRFGLVVRLLASLLGFTAFAWTALRMGDLTRDFWSLTGDTTLNLVAIMLAPLADGPVVRPGDFVIGTDTFQVHVASSCSGFHGIGLITVLLTGYLWWFRERLLFPRAILLLPLGIVLIWLANAVRITALLLVGIWLSPAIAVDGFHSMAGWIAFLTVGLGLIWASSRSSWFARPEWMHDAGQHDDTATSARAAPPAVASLPATSCIVPFLALTAITMLTRAFTSGFDALYPVRVVCVAGELAYLFRNLRWRVCRPSLLSIVIGGVTFAAWMLLAPGPSAVAGAGAASDPTVLAEPWRAVWLFFRTAGATVTVPIAEELFFRGFLARRTIGADVDSVPIGTFSWFSFLLSSVAFGLLHGEAWLAGTVAGMLFAAALYHRRHLGDAVAAHATTNALLSGYVIATESWTQWG